MSGHRAVGALTRIREWLSLRAQYETDGDLVMFRCTECGYSSFSLGTLHAHCERHRGYTRFGIQLPFTKTSIGDFDELMEYTEVIRIKETSEIKLEEVEGL